jgi:hypothetical protein
VIEAYTGIINGLADGGQAGIMLQVEVEPGVNSIAGLSKFFAKLPGSAMEDEVCKGAVGLIGDVAQNLGKASAPYLPPTLLTPILQQCSGLTIEDSDGNKVPDPSAQDILRFAQAHLATAHSEQAGS